MSEYVDWYSEIAPFFAKNGERFIIPRSTKQRAELLLEYSKQIPICYWSNLPLWWSIQSCTHLNLH